MWDGGEDIKARFKSCGTDVTIEPGVFIEHPENFEVGDRVTFMRGVTILGKMQARFGNDIRLYPHCVFMGSGQLILHDHVDFHPLNYVSIGGGLVEVGSHTHFAPGCALYGHGQLKVGEGCAFAAHTVLATVGHDHRRLDVRLVGGSRKAPITLTGDIWTGANSVILAGVTVAEGSVIGAGAVLTKDTEPVGVYLGVPARLAYTRK